MDSDTNQSSPDSDLEKALYFTGKVLEKYCGILNFEKLFQKLQIRLLGFILALLNQKLFDDDYISPLISSLALLGIDANSDSWLDALQYTGKLSAIITISRIFVIYQAYLNQNPAIIQLQKNSKITDSEARSLVPSIFENTQSLVEKYLFITQFRGQPKPFNWLIKL